MDESIRGWKTDQKKCFQGSLLGISSCLANQGGWYNSISSRWPPIKGDEWEPFNGPSVNLHPRLSSPLFNPFHHHPWNKEHSSPLPRHLLSLTRVNDAPTLPPPPLHDETCPWIPSSFSLHLLSTLGRLLVSLVTPRRAYVIRQPERTKSPPSRILRNVSIEFWACFSLQRLFSMLSSFSRSFKYRCVVSNGRISNFCHAIPSQIANLISIWASRYSFFHWMENVRDD